MESFNTKEYKGRIYETKDSFVVESFISKNSVKIEDPSDFINSKIKDFDGKNVKIEISIKIIED